MISRRSRGRCRAATKETPGDQQQRECKKRQLDSDHHCQKTKDKECTDCHTMDLQTI